MTGMTAHSVWDVATSLGEGPLWSAGDAALWFVDIERDRLHRYRPGDGACDSFAVGAQPSFIALAERGGLLVGMGHALVRFDAAMQATTVATIVMHAGNRTNDATVDGRGRLWFGTMDNGHIEPRGEVHCFDGTVRAMGAAAAITNGPAISPDGRWLYHVDTLAGQIWRFDIGGDPAALQGGTLFAAIDAADGKPDGVTVDAEGCVWVALWGGWALRRYSAGGGLLATVALPCANVTKVAFGGSDLRTGYVTTARSGLSAAALSAQPLAGALFAFAAPAPGLLPHAVRGV